MICIIILYFFGNVVESNTNLYFKYKTLYYNGGPVNLNNIEEFVSYYENIELHLPPKNKKEIKWNNINQKTEYVLYFLHGFNTNKGEGFEFVNQLGTLLKANILFARLPGNGLYNKETSYNNLSFYHSLRTIYDDLILLSILGEKIILIGSSTGCTYNVISTCLFDFNIYKNIFFSPNFGLHIIPSNIAIILSSGFGKYLVHLLSDKLVLDGTITSPDILIPLIGSMKAFQRIKHNYKTDCIIFASERDEFVSHSKTLNFFENMKANKKHLYIFRKESNHPCLTLKNFYDLYLKKIELFLKDEMNSVIKEYID